MWARTQLPVYSRRTAYAARPLEAVPLAPPKLGRLAHTHPDLRVTAPDSTDTITVPATIDTCELQVHPSAAPPERAASPNRLPRRARLALSSLTTAVPWAPTRREEPRERRPRWTRK